MGRVGLAVGQYHRGEEVDGTCTLEFLALIDNLDSMLVLLLGGFLAHASKMTVDRHDGRSCSLSGAALRATFFAAPLWRSYGAHDGRKHLDEPKQISRYISS